MDKQQTYYRFWSSFGIPAYDENSVPEGAEYPYITYQVITSDYDQGIFPTASIWYRSDSWQGIDQKLNEISRYIEEMLPIPMENGGYMHINKGSPFAQRMTEDDTTIKRYVLNLTVEFFTEY